MQACPYDALYIDPNDHTAQKCNYCVHRIEVGLEPACVVVCPEQAIVAGDLDNPDTKIAQLVAEGTLTQRAVERGTKPNLWYKGAERVNIEPLAATRSDDGGIWRDPAGIEKSWLAIDLTDGPDTNKVPTRDVADDAGHARVVYANDFPMPWGWRVSAYFLTKAISAGIAIAALVAMVFGAGLDSAWMDTVAPLVGGLFLALTGVLLVLDLKRPDRFYYLLTKGNPSSWLVRGAWILTVQAATFGVWFLAGFSDQASIARIAIWLAALTGLATAGYTAFLFGQAKGRTLWNSPVLLWHMVAAAFTVGGGVSLLASLVSDVDLPASSGAALTGGGISIGVGSFALTMLVGATGLGITALLESRASHGADAAAAYNHLTEGAFSREYRIGLVLATVVPAACAVAVLGGLPVVIGGLGGVSAAIGVGLTDDAFVKAGQSVPLT